MTEPLRDLPDRTRDTAPSSSPFEPAAGPAPTSPYVPQTPAPTKPAPPSMGRPSVKETVAGLGARLPRRPRRTGTSEQPRKESPIGPLGLPGWQPPAPAAPADPGPKVSRWRRIRASRGFDAAVTSAVTAAILFTIHHYAFEPFSVPSASMQPTLEVGDRFIAEKLSYRTGTPHRGDVVVFSGAGSWDAPGQEQVYVKRVIAVAGDTVSCCDSKGRVVVNGSALWEGYVLDDDHRPFAPLVVPKGYVWVMGDHRKVSGDSRDHGLVPVEEVIGRGVVRVWPLTHTGSLPRG